MPQSLKLNERGIISVKGCSKGNKNRRDHLRLAIKRIGFSKKATGSKYIGKQIEVEVCKSLNRLLLCASIHCRHDAKYLTEKKRLYWDLNPDYRSQNPM